MVTGGTVNLKIGTHMRTLLAVLTAVIVLGTPGAPAQLSPSPVAEPSAVAVVAPDGLARTGSTYRTSASFCAKVAKSRPVYQAPGWTVKCVWSIPGWPSNVIGLTVSARREILLKIGQRNPTSTLAHELSHAYSLDRLNGDQRAYFARRLGSSSFFSGSYFSTPAEAWANNQARCAGYYEGVPGVSYRYVSCQTLRDAMHFVQPKVVLPKKTVRYVQPHVIYVH